jgi:hypothetical protein
MEDLRFTLDKSSDPADILQIIHIEEKDVTRWMKTERADADNLMRHFKLTKNFRELAQNSHVTQLQLQTEPWAAVVEVLIEV